jgi:hypothetical protein
MTACSDGLSCRQGIVRYLEGKEHYMDFLLEIWEYLRTRKKFWLLPMLITLLLFGLLLAFTSGTAIAPFIYTLF